MLLASLGKQVVFRCSPCKTISTPFPFAILSKASRAASSSAQSSRWQARHGRDQYSREAKVQGLKSRAAFKLLQISEKYKIFKKGNTVIDLGYAPGSWSQVAVTRTAPRGRVVGVDILPAQPPRGVSTIQGDFLSPEIQAEVRAYVQDPERGRPKRQSFFRTFDEAQDEDEAEEDNVTDNDVSETWAIDRPGYLEMERSTDIGINADAAERATTDADNLGQENLSQRQKDDADGRVVDVVLSDMSEPWDQTTGFGKRSISNPYSRMMNTSGTPFRDHAGSMDLCHAALSFAFDTLRSGGHIICKFYQGAEDKILEMRLKRLFEKVHREKPTASRNESREGYFVALRRKPGPTREEVFAE